MSSAGKYKDVPASEFAGPHGTFPINTKGRARNALARAHYAGSASKEAAIRRKVFKDYPSLFNETKYTKSGHKK
jgi:hypothetical protein